MLLVCMTEGSCFMLNSHTFVFLVLREHLESDRSQHTARFYAEPKQTWNYVTVRKDAYMFWWLYYTTAVEGYTSRPIVIWLQVSFTYDIGNRDHTTFFQSTLVIVIVQFKSNSLTKLWDCNNTDDYDFNGLWFTVLISYFMSLLFCSDCVSV